MSYSNWIIPIGIFSLIVLFVVFYFLYANRCNEGVLTVSFQVLAAVLAAAALLIIALSKPPQDMQYETNVLIFRNSDNQVLRLSRVIGTINLSQYHLYHLIDEVSLFTEYTPQTDSSGICDETFGELLTAVFFKWLAYHYHTHWQMDHYYISGICGGCGGGFQLEDREDEYYTYNLSNTANGFLVNLRYFNLIQLPSESVVTIKRQSTKTIVTITNKYMTFTFIALRIGNSGISLSILGDLIDAHLRVPDSFYTQNYAVTIRATFNRWYQWSPETNRQRVWMEQIFQNFERDFSLDSFLPQFHCALEALPDNTLLEGITFKIADVE